MTPFARGHRFTAAGVEGNPSGSLRNGRVRGSVHNQAGAPVAQRIEQLPSKQWVVGSSPAGGANALGKNVGIEAGHD